MTHPGGTSQVRAMRTSAEVQMGERVTDPPRVLAGTSERRSIVRTSLKAVVFNWS